MKFTYLRLKGYTRIFNGLGLPEIEIDFTKCKNRIIVLNGRNGRGKTTIEDCASFFPDAPSEFMNNFSGEKEIHTLDGNNVYKALIVCPVNSNGNRGQTKATITKNGIELNPNGNISSYKEVIMTEFSMDSNFLALSMISSMNRGLADKTPTERKKQVGFILSALEIYNNINKTLVKRSSVFTSHINSLSNKINSIGDEATLRATLESLELRWGSLTSERDKLLQKITKIEANIEIIDPGSQIMNLYQSIFNEIQSIDLSIKSFEKEVVNLYQRCDKIDENSDIDKIVSDSNSSVSIYSTIIEEDTNKIKSALSERESLTLELNENQSKLISITSDNNYDNLIEDLTKYRTIVSDQEKIFKKLNITDFSINKDELISVYNTLKDIKELIKVFRSEYKQEDIEDTIELYIQNFDIMDNYRQLLDTQSQLNNDLNNLNLDIKEYESIRDTSNLLKSRPKGCTEDSCFFLQNALEASNKNPDNKLKELQNTKIELLASIESVKSLISEYQLYGTIDRDLREILNIINAHKSSLAKLPTSKNIINESIFIQYLKQRYEFNEIEDSDKYIQYADIINGYVENRKILNKLESEYSKFSGKEEMIKLLNSNIENIQSKLDKLLNDIELAKSDITFKSSLMDNTLTLLDILKIIKEKKSNLGELKSKKTELRDKYITIKDNIVKIDDMIKSKTDIESNIQMIDLELNPLVAERDKLKFSITQLDDYKLELDEYKRKYEIVELLKKFSSPSKGIQTLFMKLYMGKTLTLTNQLLELFFDGNIQVSDYIINENEFRIPCVIGGLERDDISSCSNAQTSMISMILSFVLMVQASEKYNIIRLDEIDGSLDDYNRTRFVQLLNQLIDVLGIEQVFVISHSSEIESVNVDYICLSGTENIMGNIIFDVDEYYKSS